MVDSCLSFHVRFPPALDVQQQTPGSIDTYWTPPQSNCNSAVRCDSSAHQDLPTTACSLPLLRFVHPTPPAIRQSCAKRLGISQISRCEVWAPRSLLTTYLGIYLAFLSSRPLALSLAPIRQRRRLFSTTCRFPPLRQSKLPSQPAHPRRDHHALKAVASSSFTILAALFCRPTMLFPSRLDLDIHVLRPRIIPR